MSVRDRILIIDDDPSHLDIAEEIIGERYDVMLAVSGARALDILQDGEVPELIILDINMPGLDGYKTFSRIREIEAINDVPILFLSGMKNTGAELAALRLGAQDFITKPFIKENLLARITLRLDESRRLREMRDRLSTTGIDEDRFNNDTAELTSSERAVAYLIAQGSGNQEIAAQLHYTLGYVNNLATSAYGKLRVRGRRELRAMFR